MSGATLPELLEALGEVFLVPGAADRDWARFGAAPWATPALRGSLPGPGPWEELDVAYAGLFLAGFRQPTVHLEESVLRTGLLQDGAVLEALDGLFSAAGLHPDPAVPADHLGVLLLFAGHLLRRAGEGDLETLARDLLQGHLDPLGRHVAGALATPGVHPFYAAAGGTLRAALDLFALLLG